MTTETKLNLCESTLAQAQTLIQANIDSYDGFKEASEKLNNPAIASLFEELASERSHFAQELQQYVSLNHQSPKTSGTALAGLHRVWMNIRGMFSNQNDYDILAEAERGEDHIKEAYEDAMKDDPGNAMSDVLHRQYAQVKSAHDRIRAMRDARKSCKG